jgi:hypothetical protein
LQQPAGRSSSGYIQRFSVRHGEHIRVLAVDDIDWIRANDNYLHIHVGPVRYLHREPLSHLLLQFDPARFLCIHRGTLVDLDLRPLCCLCWVEPLTAEVLDRCWPALRDGRCTARSKHRTCRCSRSWHSHHCLITSFAGADAVIACSCTFSANTPDGASGKAFISIRPTATPGLEVL